MTAQVPSSHPAAHPETVEFEPTREAGLKRLDAFARRAGAHYASLRNYDHGPLQRSSVSVLSPWIRHRLITEEEVLTAILAHHSPTEAMKFVQEVFWRGYFKGWLEHHPSVWSGYLTELQAGFEGLEQDAARKLDYTDAIAGRTGIACFDHWCRELTATGYLHNHARMWFASIWIFTLRLPWELGADFFLRHLIDGDPAANTLSWRWVGGLHTKGKTYLARASNIVKYTDGRFEPIDQLAVNAEPLVENFEHPFVPLSASTLPPLDSHLLLITPEDCHPQSATMGTPADVIALVPEPTATQNPHVTAFRKKATKDVVNRLGGTEISSLRHENWAETIADAATRAGTKDVLTPWAPIGPTASHLAAAREQLGQMGIRLHQEQRAYDALTWPNANKGFFKLKKKIPAILGDLGLLPS